MINQHLEAATLPEKISQQAIAQLQEFIALRPDAREVRKALAVKLVYQGYLYEEIQTILDVSLGSITGWKQAYEEHGIDGLRLNQGACRDTCILGHVVKFNCVTCFFDLLTFP